MKGTSETPNFYHIAMVVELYNAINEDRLYTYHFSILRAILEKTPSFHGYDSFHDCIRTDNDPDGTLKRRLIPVMNHGGYSVYEPIQMGKNNKKDIKDILYNLIEDFRFNKSLFKDFKNKEAIND